MTKERVFRAPSLEDVRHSIHAKVHRDLTEPIRAVALTIAKYNLSEEEFIAIVDNMVRSYNAIREAQEIERAFMEGKKS